MSGIPVHVQRRFEQRWAAKLASPGTSAAVKSIDLKGTVNSLPRPATAKEKPVANDDQLAWPFIPFPEDCLLRLRRRHSTLPLGSLLRYNLIYEEVNKEATRPPSDRQGSSPDGPGAEDHHSSD
jgi:hypothetical protein